MPSDNLIVNASEIQGETTRRGFYLGAIYTIWGTIMAALGVPALGYLLAPRRRGKTSPGSTSATLPV